MTLVVLDLGGVVVRNAGFAMLQSVSRAPDVAAVRDRWITSPTVCDFERGALDPATFAARLVAEWELTQSPADFLHDFARWITGPYEGAESVVRSLRAHHRVVAFSNSNAVHWTSLAPVIGWFDAVYSSHELGALKPDAAAFAAVLAAEQVPAGDAWFFDDTPANVAAAIALGWRAMRVDGATGLRAGVLAAGLLRD
jgi:putative hydrolase of the HAD superfamily